MSYSIKLEHFEGPLDLLLALAEQEKLDVTRISLSQIADQYLAYINDARNISLASMADFLSVASKLILIKSKALLPLLEFTEEEEEEIKDLEKQLVEYKKFKDISKIIEALFASGTRSYSKEGFAGLSSVFYPPKNITAEQLKHAFNKVLGEIVVQDKLEEEMVREVLTLEEKMTHLKRTLRERAETSFSELVAHTNDTVEIIVSFLAMLELVKQRVIHVEQDELFSEINLKHKEEE